MNWLELVRIDFSPVSFDEAMNHNRFAEVIEEKILSACKHILTKKYLLRMRYLNQTCIDCEFICDLLLK